MFKFLKGKKNHFIGIDFGTSSIKIITLIYKDQKAILENYGWVEFDWVTKNEKPGNVKSLSYEQKLNDDLKKLVEQMILKFGSAYVSIPGFSGLITILELPDMQDDELAKAIQFEAHKYIPSSLDEISMSWEVIQHIEPKEMLVDNFGKPINNLEKADGNIEEQTGGKKIKVLLVAAPKKDIERYDRLVSGVKMEVSAIELETFSLVRSLVGDDNGNFLIIDIGSRSTNIILVEKNVIIVNRNIDAGGNEITVAISDGMNISKQRAEDMKKGEKDFLNSKESYVVIPVLEFITSEAKRILNMYKEKNRDVRIDGIILSGGTSKMKGIEEYFSKSLNTKIVLGNPWRRVVVQEDVQPLVDELGGSFSVAIGLALRGVEEYKRE